MAQQNHALIAYRLLHGLTQDELAELIGIKQPYVCKLEKDSSKAPDFELAKEFAKLFNVEIGLIFREYRL